MPIWVKKFIKCHSLAIYSNFFSSLLIRYLFCTLFPLMGIKYFLVSLGVWIKIFSVLALVLWRIWLHIFWNLRKGIDLLLVHPQPNFVSNLHLSMNGLSSELNIEKFSQKFTKVILPFYDDLFLSWMNIDVNKFWFYRQSHVNEVRISSFWLIHTVCGIDNSLDFITFH